MHDLNVHAGAGISAIAFERSHQIDLGYDVEHDARNHTVEELMRIGVCYAEFGVNQLEDAGQDEPHPFWPDTIPWMPEKDPYLYITKGAAFIAAALDLKQAKDMER